MTGMRSRPGVHNLGREWRQPLRSDRSPADLGFRLTAVAQVRRLSDSRHRKLSLAVGLAQRYETVPSEASTAIVISTPAISFAATLWHPASAFWVCAGRATAT
jgi:hypothetical protein